MPSTKKRHFKDIHVANSMEELNKLADVSEMVTNPKVLFKTADKLFIEAQKHDDNNDEEMAYIFFVRYFTVFNSIKKSAQYKKEKVYYDKIMGKTRAIKAISEAEKHQKSLLKRYEERTKMKDYEEQAKKLLAKDSRNDEEKQPKANNKQIKPSLDDDLDGLLDGPALSPPVDIFQKFKVNHSNILTPEGSFTNGLHDSQALIPGLTNTVPRLTAEQLYSLIKSAHPSEFLILDVRPQKEFTKNHILHASCINIPEELLEHGVSVSNIERRLQEKTRVIWRQRGSKSCLVIVDKSSRVTDLSPSSKTFQFKEAIYNNDSSCRLSHEPFLLDGGFDGWLWHYPSLATKSELPTVSSNTNLSETIDFSALDFPDLPTEEHTKPQPPAPNLETPKINDVYPSLPNSTATSKPSMTPYQQGQVNGGEFTTPQAPKANHLPEKKPDSMVTHGPMPTVPTAVAGHTPQRPIDEHSPVVRQIPGNQQQPYLPNGTSQPSSQHYKGSPIPSNQTAVPGVVGGQSSLTGTSSQAPTVTSPPNITQQGWQPSVNQGQISGLPSKQMNLPAQMLTPSKPNLIPGEPASDQGQVPRHPATGQVPGHPGTLSYQTQLPGHPPTSNSQRQVSKHPDQMPGHPVISSSNNQVPGHPVTSSNISQVPGHPVTSSNISQVPGHPVTSSNISQVPGHPVISSNNSQVPGHPVTSSNNSQVPGHPVISSNISQVPGHPVTSSNNSQVPGHPVISSNISQVPGHPVTSSSNSQVPGHGHPVISSNISQVPGHPVTSSNNSQVPGQPSSSPSQSQMPGNLSTQGGGQKPRHPPIYGQSINPGQQISSSQNVVKPAVNQEGATPVFPSSDTKTSGYQTTPGLPPGWERCADKSNRGFYKDHNTQTTHWNLPNSIAPSTVPRVTLTAQPQTPTTKEHQNIPPSTPPHTPKQQQPIPKQSEFTPGQAGKFKSNLRRSLSSPNLANLVDDDDDVNPVINRSVKPASKPSFNRNSKPLTTQKIDSLNPVRGGIGHGLTGLRNLGNTCYMNSVLQCLFSTSPLAQYFISGTFRQDLNTKNPMGTRGELAEQFSILVRVANSGQYKYLSPSDFKRTVGKIKSSFSGFDQQDSQEFLALMMDKLHEDVNTILNKPFLKTPGDDIEPSRAAEMSWANHKMRNQSFLVELFDGLFMSTVRCLVCQKKSVTFETFSNLTLPLPGQGSHCSLKDCINLFTRPEKMSGDDKWFCPECKQHREASKQLQIWRLPPILVIHLKRFQYDGMWKQKLQTNVSFPLVDLDMSCFVTGPKGQPLYTLHAVSNHYGTMHGGHYTAFCRNSHDKRWYKFDDQLVSEISSSNSIVTSAGYLLFYTSMPFLPPKPF